MKNTGKNSQKKQGNNDTLIYLLLFFLIATVVAVSVYHFWPNSGQQETPFDYKTELGEKIINPTAEQVSKLLSENKGWEKTIQRALNSQNKKWDPGQKEKLAREFQEFNNSKSDLNNILKSTDLDKFDQKQLNDLYSLLYEQGKTLAELKSKISSDKTYEELQKQWKVTQEKWEIPNEEFQQINYWMEKLIDTWYRRFMDGELTSEDGDKRWWYIKPELINGRKASQDSPADVNYFKKLHEKDGEIIDLSKPVHIDFQGYDGFLTPKDEEESTEGKTTMGVTLSDRSLQGLSSCKEDQNGIEVPGTKCKFWFYPNNRRSISIKLKKWLFFNRDGYDEWITNVYREGKGFKRNYFDITWDALIETIAHELAHAVINSLQADYEGEKKGGHGRLHDEFEERIDKMIRKSTEYQEFKTWWEQKKKKK